MKRCLVIGTINKYPAPEGWEYVHVDIIDREIYDQATGRMVRPDVIDDVRDLRLGNAQADRVQFWDVLEHLSKEDARSALNELRRVLRPGGELDVQVPDVNAAAIAYVRGRDSDELDDVELDLDGFLQLLYGQHLGAGHREPDYHRWGWSAATLAAALGDAGFEPGANLGAGSMIARYKAIRG